MNTLIRHKKSLGIFYTPDYIIEFIMQKVLNLYRKENRFAPDNLKILDPSCGSGLFLIKAFHKLKNLYQNYNYDPEFIDRNILLNNLFGVDIDPSAIETTKYDLLLQTEPGLNRLIDLSNNIKCGNSLIDDPDIGGLETFSWGKEFVSIMTNGGFDIIIGNPPWVSLKGNHKTNETPEIILNYLLSKYSGNKYRPNLFEIFIWRSLDLLKINGYLGFIVPDRLCSNIQFKKLREVIQNNYQIKYLWFRPRFENVTSDNLVIILKKTEPTENSSVSIAEYPHTKFRNIPQISLSLRPDFKWENINDKIVELFMRIRKKPGVSNLGDRFRTGVGFIGIKDEITQEKETQDQIKIIKGKDISRFAINANHYFNFCKKNLLGGTVDFKILSIREKVFLRKTGKSIIAVYDNSGYVPEQSLYFIYSDQKRPQELKILSALLNSPILDCYYRNFGITNRNTTPQLKKMDLEKFPIIIPEEDDLIVHINNLHTLIQKQKNNQEELEIKDLISRINMSINKIYGLTPEEIELINS